VSYGCRLEDLISLLHSYSPAKADALALCRKEIEHGFLPVGLKIHCLDGGSRFDGLVWSLGGAKQVLERNHYRRDLGEKRSLCMVLPPLGSARAAVLLLETMEYALGSRLFDDPMIQLQICSPGRLDARRSALLAVCFYLGSPVLRHYRLENFSTTFSTGVGSSTRGTRLVIYDAEGDFDREFQWWGRYRGAPTFHTELPFKNGRTDILTARHQLDIKNINLVATLLVHAQYHGYWAKLGNKFAEEVCQMLKTHLLEHLLEAPWLGAESEKAAADALFIDALKELMAYAFDEHDRLEREASLSEARQATGILAEMQSLLLRYREQMTTTAGYYTRGVPR
jgi:hypothetical protein